METPLLRAASCSRRELRGLRVLMSTIVAPARAPARTPSGPYITCSSAASFVTLENTMSTPAASCLDVAATFAPRCCKGSVLSWVRSYTTTSWWAASNRPAMRLPIAPTPIKPTRIVSPQPLWILVCPIEMMGRLVELVLSVVCGERGPAEQRCHGSLAQRAKTAGGVQCLLEHRERVTARDHDARRQVHGIVEAFDGRHCAAHQDERIAHGLHPQHANVLRDQHGHHLLLEAVIMGIHHDSFEKQVMPVLVAQDIGVLGMKPLGDPFVLVSGTVTAVECLHYAMNLSTSVVITGCDSLPVLEQALHAARSFRPLSEAAVAALLGRTAGAARDGEYGLYQTTHHFDGTYQNPQWLG